MFAYVTEGKGYFCQENNPFTYEVEGENYFDIKRDPFVGNGTLVLFDNGDEVMGLDRRCAGAVPADIRESRLVNRSPGTAPIVMNTQEELKIAFEEYNKGTFIKHKK